MWWSGNYTGNGNTEVERRERKTNVELPIDDQLDIKSVDTKDADLQLPRRLFPPKNCLFPISVRRRVYYFSRLARLACWCL